jgi:hypothetical protein
MSTVVQFPGVPVSREPQLEIPPPDLRRPAWILGTEQIVKALGAKSVTDKIALARHGDLSGGGAIEGRNEQGEVLDRWGYEFRQIESPDKYYAYACEMEIGYTGRPSQTFTLLMHPRRALICPKCGQREPCCYWTLWFLLGGQLGCSGQCLGLTHAEMKTGDTASVMSMPRPLRRRSPAFEVSVVGKTIFFEKRPSLFSLLPAVFSVHMDGQYAPIGWFVADRRQLPVIRSKKVSVEL